MIIPKELLLNQLIRIPAVKERAKKNHRTGLSHHPESLARNYAALTSYSPVVGKSVLELGPGKTIEIILRAKQEGASNVAIADIEQYLSPAEAERLGIEYQIYDGRSLPFNNGTFDLIWSHDVYEHVRFPHDVVQETYRILRPGGMVVHMIDLMDHFSYGKNRQDIIFNCLKYPEWLWRAMTWNRSNYVNRLRASEWIKLHTDAGFHIISHKTELCDYVSKEYKSNAKLRYLKRFSEIDATSTSIELVASK